jgi:hypothetical protein
VPSWGPGHKTPARTLELQAAGQGGRWLAGYLVGGLAAVDRWLEARGALASLDRPETKREAQERDIGDSLTKEVAAPPELPAVHAELAEGFGAPLKCPRRAHGWSPADAAGGSWQILTGVSAIGCQQLLQCCASPTAWRIAGAGCVIWW